MPVANTILFYTTFIYFAGKKTRERRMFVLLKKYKTIPSDDLCVGAISVPSPKDEADCVYNRNKEWKVRCLIEQETCYYIDVCETAIKCFEKHFMNTIICCKYVCM